MTKTTFSGILYFNQDSRKKKQNIQELIHIRARISSFRFFDLTTIPRLKEFPPTKAIPNSTAKRAT